MTLEELWAIYAAKNPKLNGLDGDYITLTLRDLKKIFNEAWEQGYEDGAGLDDLPQSGGDSPPFDPNMFGNLFGKR